MGGSNRWLAGQPVIALDDDRSRKRRAGSQLDEASSCMRRVACSFGPRDRERHPVSSSTPIRRWWCSSFAFYAPASEFRTTRARLTCNLFADHASRQHEIEEFWLDRLGLPRSSLRRSTVSRYSNQQEEGRSNFHTARAACTCTTPSSFTGAIQEYGGFEREDGSCNRVTVRRGRDPPLRWRRELSAFGRPRSLRCSGSRSGSSCCSRCRGSRARSSPGF